MGYGEFEFDLARFQNQVRDWHRANFDPQPDLGALVVCEEAGELARAVIKGVQGVRGGKARWEAEKRKEAADVIISTIAFCCENDIDVVDAIRHRWETVGQRVTSSEEEQAR